MLNPFFLLHHFSQYRVERRIAYHYKSDLEGSNNKKIRRRAYRPLF